MNLVCSSGESAAKPIPRPESAAGFLSRCRAAIRNRQRQRAASSAAQCSRRQTAFGASRRRSWPSCRATLLTPRRTAPRRARRFVRIVRASTGSGLRDSSLEEAGFELRVPLPDKRRSDMHHRITWAGAPWPNGSGTDSGDGPELRIRFLQRRESPNHPFDWVRRPISRTACRSWQRVGRCRAPRRRIRSAS